MLTNSLSPTFGPLAHSDPSDWHVFMLIGVAASYVYNRVMVNVTQGTLRNLRDDMFAYIWNCLPIRYFDTHSHGDIMSIYTNDIDTLRQMISQSIPQTDQSVRSRSSVSWSA